MRRDTRALIDALDSTISVLQAMEECKGSVEIKELTKKAQAEIPIAFDLVRKLNGVNALDVVVPAWLYERLAILYPQESKKVSPNASDVAYQIMAQGMRLLYNSTELLELSAISGAMRWPWSQEARIMTNVEACFK